MIIPSLKKIKTDGLGLLYVDAIRQWANAPAETWHGDLASAAAGELERRGHPVPTDQVREEFDTLMALALHCGEHLKLRFCRGPPSDYPPLSPSPRF